MARRRSSLLELTMVMAMAMAIALGSGCSIRPSWYRVPLSPEDLRQHGSWTFPGELPTVLRATARALQAEGFEIAMVNETKGLLVTKPKLYELQASATAYSHHHVRLDARSREVQIRAELHPVGPSHVRVTLVPRPYTNGNAVSGARWNLFFLRRTWSTLLRGIDEALPGRGEWVRPPPLPLPRPRDDSQVQPQPF